MRSVRTLLVAAVAVAATVVTGPALAAPPVGGGPQAPVDLPTHINGGAWPTSHVQGVTVDTAKGFVYWSFTQTLVKTDLAGNVIGTVEGLTGHLGDIDLNPQDGRVYGSLEYKAEEAFYIAIFDVDAIDRVGMNAERDGVMTAVHLEEVVEDFTADMDGNGVFDGDTANTADHRYGCSGIDGVSFGPSFGSRGGQQKLMVAYGVYSHTGRADNDHQVILEYDVRHWSRYERPLTQSAPHRSGPHRTDGKYFVRTGNTTYGVQNLQYDPHTGNWLMAVYTGRKQEFPNYSFFMVDGSARPKLGEITGQPEPERGRLLSLVRDGRHDPATGVYGWDFHGNYGLEALGNGYYYAAEGRAVTVDGQKRQQGEVYLYRWTGRTPTPFERVIG
ncbi:hypothetical protein AQ490_27155 [Wenjunlia vitaminophila]|uniref:Uncharacterized protein n=1 Tax=Wenjunlia vitaminophila TaxID=76728 RepID=A0A0T6LPL3_WENVI|nr:hypothetical protein [Wenjunlia vitaminophila]KRV48013.1 hypothetical protein AQ490_27155 [Wenjunlia vitaminophila]